VQTVPNWKHKTKNPKRRESSGGLWVFPASTRNRSLHQNGDTPLEIQAMTKEQPMKYQAWKLVEQQYKEAVLAFLNEKRQVYEAQEVDARRCIVRLPIFTARTRSLIRAIDTAIQTLCLDDLALSTEWNAVEPAHKEYLYRHLWELVHNLTVNQDVVTKYYPHTWDRVAGVVTAAASAAYTLGYVDPTQKDVAKATKDSTWDLIQETGKALLGPVFAYATATDESITKSTPKGKKSK
jgi:hypothetical protein